MRNLLFLIVGIIVGASFSSIGQPKFPPPEKLTDYSLEDEDVYETLQAFLSIEWAKEDATRRQIGAIALNITTAFPGIGEARADDILKQLWDKVPIMTAVPLEEVLGEYGLGIAACFGLPRR